VTIPGARTKDGYGIYYAKFGNMVPEDHGKNFVNDILDYILWNNMVGSFYEDMDFHRNGLCFVADMKAVGWKNMDLKLQKTVNSALMDNFPMKISQVLVLNPPGIFKPLLAGSRLFVKKKIMDRIQIVEPEDLLNFISSDQLSADFGGDLQFTIETYIDWVDSVISSGLPKTPIQVPLKARSKGSYPRDEVIRRLEIPAENSNLNASNEDDAGDDDDAGSRKTARPLTTLVSANLPSGSPNKSRRFNVDS